VGRRKTKQPFFTGVDTTTMRSSSSSVFALGLIVFSLAACSSSGGDSPAGTPGPGEPGGTDTPPGADGPKAPPVGGPASSDELTEKFGVFVAPSGADNADGTRERPLARIQPAIDLAKKLGKRVYVCTGVYREALVLADSISVIGGLECSTTTWRVGAAHTRIESPTIPAIDAKDIVTATRLESLDVLAPAATTPGGSSIALRAEKSGALVIATSRLIAGDAAKGDDGTEGIQLANAATINGAAGTLAKDCNAASYPFSCGNVNYKPAKSAGGTNLCQGAAGIAPGAGGYGGSGGHWEVYFDMVAKFRPYGGNLSNFEESGNLAPTSAAGSDGQAGTQGNGIGVVIDHEYKPIDGTPGANGGPGAGGAGGSGSPPTAGSGGASATGAGWYGFTGAAGGAGGCPGLAGTAGKGGGASIAAFLIASPLTLEGTELIGGHGGDGGLGTFGSSPTEGGAPGPNPGGFAETAGKPGGRGGLAGVSGNGASGPSIAVAHDGQAPKIVGDTKLTPGAGGNAINERTRDTLGTIVTIPASPAGPAQGMAVLQFAAIKE
jgi:hypothetical protein